MGKVMEGERWLGGLETRETRSPEATGPVSDDV